MWVVAIILKWTFISIINHVSKCEREIFITLCVTVEKQKISV